MHAVDPAGLFEVDGDPARHFLHLRFRGVWDQAVFAGFADAYRRVYREMERRGGVTHALVDGSAFGFQSEEITERFPELIDEVHAGRHRIAIVISALVNKVQARRAGEMLDARYFHTVGDATDWLFGNEA